MGRNVGGKGESVVENGEKIREKGEKWGTKKEKRGKQGEEMRGKMRERGNEGLKGECGGECEGKWGKMKIKVQVENLTQ